MKKLLSQLAEFTEKYRNYITYALFFFSLILIYQIYQSINAPIEFNKVKNERYLKVIDRLKDIRNAQIAFKSVNGIYSSSFDELIKFVDSAQFTIVQKRDSSFMQYDRVYRIDMLREVVVIDTLGFVSVKDSLFKNDNRYKMMAYYPIKGIEDSTFSIKADMKREGNFDLPVFEVRAHKSLIFQDLETKVMENLKQAEYNLQSVDGVNGPDIVLGNFEKGGESGNWPTTFDFGRK